MNQILNNSDNSGFYIEIKVSDGLILKDKEIKSLDELKEVIKNPICIQGMPGMADIGKMAVDQLVLLLDAKKIIDIVFDDFPAGAIVSDSILYSPRAEVYYYYNEKSEIELLIFTADAQPMSPRGIHAFSRFISKLINFFNAKLIISLGAFPVEHPSKNNCVYITGTSKEVLNFFNKQSFLFELNKGIIIGLNGLVPTLCKYNYNIDGIILLAETNGFEAMKKDSYDIKASMQLLNILSNKFNLDINNEKFNKKLDVETIEAKIKSEKEAIKKELNSSKKKPMTLPYFG